MSLDRIFQEYFAAVERAGGEDRCFVCRRSPADVKAFFGFHEDGTPIEQEAYGIEDVVLDRLDIMSYRGERPVCAICQLNVDGLELCGEGDVLLRLLESMARDRDVLWPEDAAPPGSAPTVEDEVEDEVEDDDDDDDDDDEDSGPEPFDGAG